MGFTLKLIVHGVPMGHKTWGANDADYKYIKGFYGATTQTPERMIAEVQTINNQTLCYYTFIKGTGIHAWDGRPGAYFALTLCTNAYYADIQNIYDILHAAYAKLCVGSILQVQEKVQKFYVNDFAAIDKQLKEIEQQIINYIGVFSNPEDLIPLTEFNSEKSATTIEVNLHECKREDALQWMKSTHRITVSPYFPSQYFANELTRRDAELLNLRQQTQQQIADMQKQQNAAFAKAHDEMAQLQALCSQLQQENAVLRKNSKQGASVTEEKKNDPSTNKKKENKGLLSWLFSGKSKQS